jgi:hypothetical protein
MATTSHGYRSAYVGTPLEDMEERTGLMVTNLRGERIGHVSMVSETVDYDHGYSVYRIEVVVPLAERVASPVNNVIDISEPVENYSSLKRRELPR